MSFEINIELAGGGLSMLDKLWQGLEDTTALNAYVAASAEAGTRQYIRAIAVHTHATAERLGATPTNYLSKRAELTESRSDANGATITVNGAIFRRVFGPVTVTAKHSKWLTIPANAAAYGKSAREFSDLRVQFFGKGLMGLVKAEQSNLGTRARAGYTHDRRIAGESHAPLQNAARPEVYYWLKKSVVLPQDDALLPDAQAYGEYAELGARAYLRKAQRDAGL
jgi:hypothetical protein